MLALEISRGKTLYGSFPVLIAQLGFTLKKTSHQITSVMLIDTGCILYSAIIFDPENGALITNPALSDTRWQVKQLDVQLFSQIQDELTFLLTGIVHDQGHRHGELTCINFVQ
jgi:hypothetical protein